MGEEEIRDFPGKVDCSKVDGFSASFGEVLGYSTYVHTIVCTRLYNRHHLTWREYPITL